MLEPDLRPEDLPDLLDQLIALAAGEERDLAPVPWRLPSSPEGRIAASHVDLPTVTARIIEHLASDDEPTREAGADAARVLLTLDATRVVALGHPLAASVRGPDSPYAGYPHPAGAALRALAEAWRGEPEMTRRIIEAEAAGASNELRSELSRVPWFVRRFREQWDASVPATSEAISFVARRAGGDWGEEAANRAADHLTGLAREIPEAVAAHADELLGAILALCAPEEDSPTAVPETPSIQPEHLTTKERAEHGEHLSRLWEYVYGLRVELIAAHRLSTWPDEEHNSEKLQETRDTSLWQLARLLNCIHDYLERYGERIMHGEADFSAEALIRLAGWRGELPPELAYRLGLLAMQYPTKEGFVGAMRSP